jgi:hypothetical protein
MKSFILTENESAQRIPRLWWLSCLKSTVACTHFTQLESSGEHLFSSDNQRNKKGLLMKYFNCWLLLSCTALLSACASPHAPTAPVALQPIGPAPHEQFRAPNEGYLVVYSAPKLFGFVDSTVILHSSYVISSEDGKPDQRIQNYRDRYDEEPVRVSLLPGCYKVSARSAHSGRVNVQVIIKKGETTFVHLDGSTPERAASAGGANLVKLPDGQIVGWPADASAK